MAQLEMLRTLLEDVTRFVPQVYFLDVCAVAAVSGLAQDW